MFGKKIQENKILGPKLNFLCQNDFGSTFSVISEKTSVPWNNEPAPFGFKWNFGEKKLENIFPIFEKLFTLNTKPLSAKIEPKIGFSQAKWLYHSALGEILKIKNFFFELWKIIHPLH